ncbi:glycosyltransferase family 2 protein [Gleimia sp. 6138-11-ORH1]|uniref:glycosyltransferase family 2 protein n=1 Tax=Gleimia sp. 6138-11-ORH1 TaxID=2973937 RepID=UPI00216734C6|nr:glycosyltransferase family 2 protein [Gleimia sp. 6138-11-ORH1]MCS4485085.1 glycosyltransferase family 2 protein [Gleimia sp. 6138-11-ORH1]
METTRRQNKIAVVIPAHNEARRIAATVRACRALPGVDLLIVVDDGSADNTQDYARGAGAVVVRHAVNRGKASAMETGVKVAAMRDLENGKPRDILFLDADLADSAVEATALIEILQTGQVDCAIATLLPAKQPKNKTAVKLARKAIYRATGWKPQCPLSGQRLITRQALDQVMPFANGWGVEVGMTIDLLRAGFTVQEVPCDFSHRDLGTDVVGKLHGAEQYKDVLLAVASRKLARMKQLFTVKDGQKVSRQQMKNAIQTATSKQGPGIPYHLEF